jgi:hypothetical protein
MLAGLKVQSGKAKQPKKEMGILINEHEELQPLL